MSSTLRPFLARLLPVAAAALALTASTLTVPAHAAPPANDSVSGATEITALPARFEADTRSATRDRVARQCVFGRSVWYRYAPVTTGRVKVTTIGSSLDTVLAVYRGVDSPQTLLACNDDAAHLQSAVRPRFVAGRTYWIAVSSCCGEGNGRGGDLVLRLYQGAPDLQLTVDTAESGAVSGRIRVHGTVACATPSVVFANIFVSQRVGDGVAQGGSEIFLRDCPATSTAWTVRIDSYSGWAFQPGTIAVDVTGQADDGFDPIRLTLDENVTVTDDPSGRRS